MSGGTVRRILVPKQYTQLGNALRFPLSNPNCKASSNPLETAKGKNLNQYFRDKFSRLLRNYYGDGIGPVFRVCSMVRA
jgi:hypothetical protein